MKIAALVKHPIVRQIPLAIAREKLLICDDRRRIVEFMCAGGYHRRASWFRVDSIALADIAHHDDKTPAMADYFMKGAEVVRDKPRLEQEIFRWIASDRQFGECDQVGLRLLGLAQPGRDPADVPSQIPDR